MRKVRTTVEMARIASKLAVTTAQVLPDDISYKKIEKLEKQFAEIIREEYPSSDKKREEVNTLVEVNRNLRKAILWAIDHLKEGPGAAVSAHIVSTVLQERIARIDTVAEERNEGNTEKGGEALRRTEPVGLRR